MWFIGVEVEQEKSARPLLKNPGSAPASTLSTNLLEQHVLKSTWTRLTTKNGNFSLI